MMKYFFNRVSSCPEKSFPLTMLTIFLTIAATSFAQNRMIEQTRGLPWGRAFHGSAVLGDYLYVFGGGTSASGARDDEKPDNSVWKARILANGHLEPWGPTTPTPGPRYYIANSTIVLNDVVYIIGGSRAVLGGERIDTAIWAKPLGDGTLTPWMQSEPFGEGLSTITAVSTPGYLHVIGELKEDDVPTNHVWSNRLYEDGSMSSWEPAPSLPLPLWFHQAGVASGRVYVWGGIPHPDDGRPIQPSNLIFSAPIMGGGHLGTWRQERSVLPVPVYQTPSAVAGPYLLSFCPPFPGGVLTSDVWWSSVTPAGMSAWSKLTTGIPNRVYHAVAPDYRRGTIYLSGGRGPVRSTGMLKNVFVFRLSPQAREQAAQTWMASERAHGNSVSTIVASAQMRRGEEETVLSYTADSRLPETAVQGFMPVTRARTVAQQSNLPLVLYFTMPLVTPAQEQKKLLQTEQFQQVLARAAFAWIDSTEQPQLAQQIGIYRVPSWVFFNSSGEMAGRHIGVMTAQEVAGVLDQLR